MLTESYCVTPISNRSEDGTVINPDNIAIVLGSRTIKILDKYTGKESEKLFLLAVWPNNHEMSALTSLDPYDYSFLDLEYAMRENEEEEGEEEAETLEEKPEQTFSEFENENNNFDNSANEL